MEQYLLIESRDPYESCVVQRHFELALRLREAGHRVTVFLVQNAVLPTRPRAAREALMPVLAADVEVLADEFSLRERGIDPRGVARSADGIRAASVDVVVERMAAGWKAVFL